LTELVKGDTLSPEEWKRRPRWAITVSRRRHTITIWFRREDNSWQRVRTAKCAVGAIGFRTPKGVFSVLSKAQNPDWQKPRSRWVPESEWGQIIPGGDPANPIKVAFMKLTHGGVGIHGTADLSSLGKSASHGCIRVHPDVAKYVYDHVPVSAQVVVY